MAATPSFNFYSRLTDAGAVAGGPETKVLSAGVAGVNWLGTLTYPAFTQGVGDITRILAWGTMFANNPENPAPGRGQIRLYFNPNAALNNPIANTSVPGVPPPQNAPFSLPTTG